MARAVETSRVAIVCWWEGREDESLSSLSVKQVMTVERKTKTGITVSRVKKNDLVASRRTCRVCVRGWKTLYGMYYNLEGQ